MNQLRRLIPILSLSLSLLWGFTRPTAAAPIPVSPAGVEARHPAVAVSADGVLHIVWEQNGGLWQRYRQGDTWSSPTEIVAEGEQPTLAAAPIGDDVVLAWSQSFGENYEIFTSRWDGAAWSQSQNVSSNGGGSVSPTLAVAPTGEFHLIWADTSPGQSTLYHAESSDGLNWPTASPIPGTTGSGNPTAVFAADGTLHVAWQQRASFSEKLRIWNARFDGAWQTPQAVTDGSQQALAAALAAGTQGDLYLSWQEGDGVKLAHMQNSSWQLSLSEEGEQPALAITAHGDIYWAWEKANHLAARFGGPNWPEPTTWADDAQNSGDIALTLHGAHVVTAWAAEYEGVWRISTDTTALDYLYLPLLTS